MSAGGFEPGRAGDAPDVLAAQAGDVHELGLADTGLKGLDDRGVELVACAAELLLGAVLRGEGLADAAAWLAGHARILPQESGHINVRATSTCMPHQCGVGSGHEQRKHLQW